VHPLTFLKVLHRDIKSKNIFVKTPMGSSEFLTVVQLGDFGIARVLLNTADVSGTAMSLVCLD
jgi:serine/threonine protein kinase